MRIDSPLMTNAIVTGSFSGSFTGAFDGDITADSVAYDNITGKPTLISSSAQITITESQISDLTHYTDSDVKAKLDSDAVVSGSATNVRSFLNVENGADVTDSENVQLAGALMDSEITNLTQVKTFDSSDYATAAQGTAADNALPKAGGQMTGNITFSGAQTVDGRDLSADGAKLDNIEASATADQTDAEIRAAVEAATDSNVFTDADHTKLNAIEANADVTDSTNVTAAGALMDTEVSSLSGIKTLTVPDSTTISSFGASLVDDADAAAARTTLGVDASGTDNSTDVTLAGASYLTLSGQEITAGTVDISSHTNLAVSDTTGQTGINLTLTGDTISGVVSGLDTSDNVQFNNLTVSGDLTVSGTTTSINSTDLNVTDKLISINRGGATAASADGGGLFISGANESITWDNGNSRFNFSDDVHAAGNITLTGTVDGRDVASDGTKLDGIESGATADQSNAEIRAAVEAATDSNVFTDADHTKLNGIESSATADQTDAEIRAAVEAATDSNVFTDADHTKLNGIEAGADVTDSTNVTAAGALMDTEVTDLVGIKGVTISTLQVKPSEGAFANGDKTKLDGIETGATADQTQADINGLLITDVGTITTGTWNGTAIADAYLSSNTAHLSGAQTFSGAKTFSAAVTVSNNTASTSKTTGAVKVTGGVGIQGDVFAGGDVVAYASSDERLKDNVAEISNALDKVEKLRGVSFDWNDKQSVYSGHDIGVIAQDVEEVLPELVENRDNGYKAVKYDKLTAVLIQAVKELSAKVKELENK